MHKIHHASFPWRLSPWKQNCHKTLEETVVQVLCMAGSRTASFLLLRPCMIHTRRKEWVRQAPERQEWDFYRWSESLKLNCAPVWEVSHKSSELCLEKTAKESEYPAQIVFGSLSRKHVVSTRCYYMRSAGDMRVTQDKRDRHITDQIRPSHFQLRVCVPVSAMHSTWQTLTHPRIVSKIWNCTSVCMHTVSARMHWLFQGQITISDGT